MHRNRRLLSTHTYTHIVTHMQIQLERFKATKRHKNKQQWESLSYYGNNTKARSDKMRDMFMGFNYDKIWQLVKHVPKRR